MATLADLEQQKNTTLAELDRQLADALANQNAASTQAEQQRWADAADQIDKKSDEFLHQVFQRENSSEEIKKAIDVLKAATTDMMTAAGRMKQATTFVSGLADLLGAIDSAIGALK